MRQEIINLYDEFTHRGLERRVFMQRLAELAGGTAAAAAVLPLLEANYAAAAMIEEGDGRVTAERVSVPGQAGDIKGYLVRPAAASGRLPAVVVVHENRGLNPHIEDVARRAAVAGFVALAPDFLSRAGGTPADPDQARDMIGKLDQQGVVEDARSLIAWLGNDERTNGKVGIVGFCWGGGVVGRVAEEVPELDAGVGVLRPGAAVGRGVQDQGSAALELCRHGRERERRRARVPRGLGQGRRALRAAHVRGRPARLPQRHLRGALQRGSGEAGLGAHDGLLQGEPRLSTAGR